MIKINVKTKDSSTDFEIPNSPCLLQYELALNGIRKNINDIPLTKDGMFKVTLASDSDFGNHLLSIFDESNTIEELNRATFLLTNMDEAYKDEFESLILHDQLVDANQLFNEIQEFKDSSVNLTIDYYCPLRIEMYDREEDESYDVSPKFAASFIDEIAERLQYEQKMDLNDMADYFNRNDSAKAKLVSAIWDVENVNGELFGVIHTKLKSAFTSEEEKAWIDELIGQAADGFGEGFEQRPIQTSDGEMYVSFWNSGSDYFMENQDDFDQRIQSDIYLQ